MECKFGKANIWMLHDVCHREVILHFFEPVSKEGAFSAFARHYPYNCFEALCKGVDGVHVDADAYLGHGGLSGALRSLDGARCVVISFATDGRHNLVYDSDCEGFYEISVMWRNIAILDDALILSQYQAAGELEPSYGDALRQVAYFDAPLDGVVES